MVHLTSEALSPTIAIEPLSDSCSEHKLTLVDNTLGFTGAFAIADELGKKQKRGGEEAMPRETTSGDGPTSLQSLQWIEGGKYHWNVRLGRRRA